MKHDCEICRGAGIIRLPIYRRMAVHQVEISSAISIEDAARTYPCPECADIIPLERVGVIQTNSEVQVDIDDQDFWRYAKRHAANMLAIYLLEAGFIQFSRGPRNEQTMTRPLRAMLGVVSSAHVASLEQRIAERQEEVARELIEEAAREIRHWHSDYSGDEGPIHKAQAVLSLHNALKTIHKRRASMKRC